MEQGRGRHDRRLTTGTWMLFEYWWVGLMILVAFLIVAWHLAVVATTPAQIDDLEAAIGGLANGHPLRDIPGAGIGTIVLFILELLLVLGIIFGIAFVMARFRGRSPGKGMATKEQVRDFLSQPAVLDQRRDGRLWPADSDVPDHERTFCVGTARFGMGSLEAHLGQQQHLGVVAPTGRGKTYRVLTRAALDAPGALVTTSTRADVLDVIAEPRSHKGRVWVWDLLDLVSWPTPMRWNIVAGCEDSEVARARAGQLVKGGTKKDSRAAGGGDSNSEFFQGRARTVLQCYLHAAALSGEHTIVDVLQWAAEFESDRTALKILREHPDADPLLGRRLNSALSGAGDTVSSIRQTLDDALDALSLSKINRQFITEAGEGFDPDAFVRSTDTLVVIADDNDPTDVTSLAALLIDAVFQAAKNAARKTATGRLCPPLRAVLDEVANICPLPTFPKMLSDLRGYGVHIVYGLQSRAQTELTWGEQGAQMIVDNSAGLLVLGGIKDTQQLKDLSELAGMVEVNSVSTQMRDHGLSRGHQTLSEQDKNVLRPEEITRLETNEGLLIMGDIPHTALRLPGWTERPDGEDLKKHAATTADKRVQAHQQAASAA